VLIRESPGVRGVSYVRVLVGCQTVSGGIRGGKAAVNRQKQESPHGAGFLGCFVGCLRQPETGIWCPASFEPSQ